MVDWEPDMDYFDTIEEACNRLSSYLGKRVAASWEADYTMKNKNREKICHLSPNMPETSMDKGFMTGDRWVTDG